MNSFPSQRNIVSSKTEYTGDFRSKWDALQKHLRCCGGNNYLDFDNRLKPDLNGDCVPKSCCINDEICNRSENNCKTAALNLFTQIYTAGCMTIVENLYKTELDSGLLVYAIAIAIIALICVVAVALGFAFVAQLSRREKRYNVSQGMRTDNDRGSIRLEQF